MKPLLCGTATLDIRQTASWEAHHERFSFCSEVNKMSDSAAITEVCEPNHRRNFHYRASKIWTVEQLRDCLHFKTEPTSKWQSVCYLPVHLSPSPLGGVCLRSVLHKTPMCKLSTTLWDKQLTPKCESTYGFIQWERLATKKRRKVSWIKLCLVKKLFYILVLASDSVATGGKGCGLTLTRTTQFESHAVREKVSCARNCIQLLGTETRLQKPKWIGRFLSHRKDVTDCTGLVCPSQADFCQTHRSQGLVGPAAFRNKMQIVHLGPRAAELLQTVASSTTSCRSSPLAHTWGSPGSHDDGPTEEENGQARFTDWATQYVSVSQKQTVPTHSRLRVALNGREEGNPPNRQSFGWSTCWPTCVGRQGAWSKNQYGVKEK